MNKEKIILVRRKTTSEKEEIIPKFSVKKTVLEFSGDKFFKFDWISEKFIRVPYNK